METVPVRLSNHHVHLCEESVEKLFGKKELTFLRYLDGKGKLVAYQETVKIIGPKGEIGNFRVLGPLRGKDQVELLKADCFKLGVSAPVRMSGDLTGAAELTLEGPCGTITEKCGIIAHRHIHVFTGEAERLGLSEDRPVQVRIGGERGLIFENVKLKISPLVTAHKLMMHIDTEEGNAAGISNNTEGELILS